ncbi:hypothetical protein CRE_23410 [Caenorhabditis remanei]|uniref:DUF38 domain-containing protein n=1 Tax=Caenorhabditis remanei TaxID=31234 RepID=E3MGN2_CAERE|nr:hypothetical protein CRE_23410 [Caenorhabditis remanei]
MSPSFLEIPDIPMEMIMNNLDYLAILLIFRQSVRKTCWVLRNFIDDKKPGIRMKEIRISQKSDTAVGLAINLPTSGPGDDTYIILTYEKHENGCRIKGGTSDGDKNKIVENVNFLDAVLHDLKVALNFKKSIFEEITVCGASFFEKFEEIMKSQKPFGAEFIVIHDNSLEHARQILKHADPKYLKQIVITSHDPCYIRECVRFESSKSSKTFSHFATTSIQLENLEVETIRAIKEVCLFVLMSICINFFSELSSIP